MEELGLCVTTFMTGKVVEFLKKFVVDYVAEKTTDNILVYVKKRFDKNSFEYQVASILDETLESTCNYFGWEYDVNAIAEVSMVEWDTVYSLSSEKGLKTMLKKLIKMDISDEVYLFWMDCFSKNISNPKYQWVYNYLNNQINGKKHEEDRLELEDDAALYCEKYEKALFLHRYLDNDKQISLKDIYVSPFCHLKNTLKVEDDTFKVKNILKYFLYQKPMHSSEIFWEVMFLEGLPALGKSSFVSWIIWNCLNKDNFSEEYLGGRKIFVIRMRDLFTEERRQINVENPMITIFDHLYKYKIEVNKLLEQYQKDARVLFQNSVLILDGFDELCMTDAIIKDHGTVLFLNMYRELQRLRCNCKVLITTRPNYIEMDYLNFPFIYVELLPFDADCRMRWLEKYSMKYPVREELCKLITHVQSEQLEYMLQIPLVLYMVVAKNLTIEKEKNYWNIYYTIFHEEVYARNYENMEQHSTSIYREDLYSLTSEIAYAFCEERNLFTSIEKLLERSSIKEIIEDMEIKDLSDDASIQRLKSVLENCVALCSYFKVEKRKVSNYMDRHIIEFCHNNIKDFFCCEYIWDRLDKIYANVPEDKAMQIEYFMMSLQDVFQYATFMKDSSFGGKSMVFFFLKEKMKYYKEKGIESFVTKEMTYQYFQHFFGKMLETGFLTEYKYNENGNVLMSITNIYASVFSIYKAIYSIYESEKLIIVSDAKQKINIGTSFIFSIIFKLTNLKDHTHVQFDEIPLSLLEFPDWDFSFSSFRNSLMRYTVFKRSNLSGVDFSGANLDYSDFHKAIIDDETCFEGCSCKMTKVTKEQVPYFERYGMTDLDIQEIF